MNASSSSSYKATNQTTTAGLISLEQRTKKKKKKKKKQVPSTSLKKPGDNASIAEMMTYLNHKKNKKNTTQPQILSANSTNRKKSKHKNKKQIKRTDDPDTLLNNTSSTSTTNTLTKQIVVDRSKWTLDDLLGRLQRDLNLLTEDSQKKRLQALERLELTLFSPPDPTGLLPPTDASKAVPDESLRQFYPHAMKPLLRRFADPMETCREIAIRLMVKFVENTVVTPDLAPTLPYAWPAILERTSLNPHSRPVGLFLLCTL